MFVRSTLTVAVMLVSAALDAPARADESFHDEETGANMTLPRGWAKVEDKKVAAFPIAKPDGGDAAYLGGYSRAAGGGLALPFVLIEQRRQSWPLEDASYKDIQSRLHLIPLDVMKKNGQFDFKNRYKGDGLSPAVFDQDNNRILVQGSTTMPDGQAAYLYSVNFLGASDMVRVNCYLRPEGADGMIPEVERMIGSFAFDSGMAYEPPEPPPSRSRYGRRGPIGGIFCGVAILGYFLRRWAAD